jgi:hypothetical protein
MDCYQVHPVLANLFEMSSFLKLSFGDSLAEVRFQLVFNGLVEKIWLEILKRLERNGFYERRGGSKQREIRILGGNSGFGLL